MPDLSGRFYCLHLLVRNIQRLENHKFDSNYNPFYNMLFVMSVYLGNSFKTVLTEKRIGPDVSYEPNSQDER